MTEKYYRWGVGIVLVAIAILTMLWATNAEACESKQGKVCPDELPAAYALTCADGCYLVTKQRFEQYKADGKAVFKLRQDLDELIVVATDFQDRRNYERERSAVANALADQRTEDLLKSQAKLAERPSWATVMVGTVIGTALGTGLTLVWIAQTGRL